MFNKGEKRMEKELMNVDELCRYLKISKSTAYIWAWSNKIPKIKIGSRLLFDKASINDFINKKSIPSKVDSNW